MTSGRVFIIDDDAAVRRGVKALLDAVGFSSETYQSADAFLDKLGDLDWRGAAALVDVCMPGMTGPQLLNHLRKQNVRIPFVIMTAQGDVVTAVEVMRNGAADFLEKPFTADELSAALGRAFAASSAIERTERSGASDAKADVDSLTAREREILLAIVDGNSSKEIARNLDLSPRTVEVHRRNIMTKMRVSNLAELVRRAIVAGLIDI